MNSERRLYPNLNYEQQVQSVQRRRKWACRIILLAQFFERITFYSMMANMVLLLNAHPYNWTAHNASSATLILSGLTFVSALLGGLLADSLLGRYWTIVAGYVLYIIAYLGFPALFYDDVIRRSEVNASVSVPQFCKYFSLPKPSNGHNANDDLHTTTITPNDRIWLLQEECGGFVLLVMLGVAVGSGFLKAVFAPFGADQVRSDSGILLRSYFNTYYWTVNSGSFVAYLVLAYVQQNVSLFIGYAAPWVCLVLSAITFVAGHRLYYHRPVTGSILVDVLGVVKEATCRSCRSPGQCCCCCCCGCGGAGGDSHGYLMINHNNDDDQQRLLARNSRWRADSSGGPESSTDSTQATRRRPSSSAGRPPGFTGASGQQPQQQQQPPLSPSPQPRLNPQQQQLSHVRCLDRAKYRYGGTHHESMVDDVRALGRTVGLLLFLIPYWLVYYQMESGFLVQGLHMRLNVLGQNGSGGIVKYENIPVAWLTLADILTVLLVIPLLNKFFYPFIDRKRLRLSLYQRIVYGMCFSLVAVVVAGVLETQRFRIFWEDTKNQIKQYIGETLYIAADLSILWQLFQYALIGLGEAFTCVAGLELAYGHSPRSMQSVMSGIFYFINGVASFLGALLITAFYGVFFFNYDNGDPNCYYQCHEDGTYCKCQLDNYFYVLAGIQAAGILGFLLAVRLLKNESDPTLMHSIGHKSNVGETSGVVGNGGPSGSTSASVLTNPQSSNSGAVNILGAPRQTSLVTPGSSATPRVNSFIPSNPLLVGPGSGGRQNLGFLPGSEPTQNRPLQSSRRPPITAVYE